MVRCDSVAGLVIVGGLFISSKGYAAALQEEAKKAYADLSIAEFRAGAYVRR